MTTAGCVVSSKLEDIVRVINQMLFYIVIEFLQSAKLHNATFYAIPWDGDVALAKKMQFMNMRTRIYFEIPIGDSAVVSNEYILKVKQSYINSFNFNTFLSIFLDG